MVRVAFFTDSFHEINGVAHTSRQLDVYARRNGLPMLSVHAGPETRFSTDGVHQTLELRRSSLRIPLDEGLSFDLLLARHWSRVRRAVERFKPDVIHITGPSDLGIMGASISHKLKIPVVGSWHTNLHEYAGTRIARWAEGPALDILSLYYRIPKQLLAPNEELRALLESRTQRPCGLMLRGVDCDLFSPERRARTDGDFVIGYVGRLRPEKNVRLLARVDQVLRQAGCTNYRFLIVGDGSERSWLSALLPNSNFPGVLKGEALAEAYASMDLFAFPSETDTYGNVVAEALASGVPCTVTDKGGPKFLVGHGQTGFITTSPESFAEQVAGAVKGRDRLIPMRKAARDWALERSWDSVFAKVWAAYGRAASPKVSMGPCPPPFATVSS